MSRNVLFVLLLTMGVALAQVQPRTGAAQEQAETRQTKTEAVQQQAEAAQVEKEAAQGQTEMGQEQTKEETKLISVPGGKALGMSILGNQEAPKALVIVPWKSSELGGSLGISPMLDDSRVPIDKEVFMRMLSYYEIRSGTARQGGAPSKTNTAQLSTAAQRRKP